MSGGKVQCWGDKGDGTLGDGSANRQVTPMDVAWLTYSISGRVAASDGVGIPAVRITADTGNRTTTDASGNFVLDGLPAASYTVSAWKPGFALSSPLQVKLTTSDIGGQSFTATPLPDTILDVRYVDQVFVQQSLENGYWNDCGPSSVAMMMHYYGVEPRDVFTDRQPALDLVPKVKYGGTGGSSWDLISNMFTTSGFAFSLKSIMDEQEIRDSIHHGHPVILSVTNPSHVFVINGVKSDGTLVVQDPMGAKSWNAGATSDLRRNDTPWLGAGHFNPPRTKGQGVEYSYAELVAKGFVRLLRVTDVASPPAPVTATVTTAGGTFQGNNVRIDFAPSAQTQAQVQQGEAQTLRITASAQLGPRQSISGYNAAIASFRVDAATLDGAPTAQADATFKMTVSIDPAILRDWNVTGGSTPGPDGTVLRSSPGPMPIEVALALAYWNTTTQRWELAPTVVDAANSQVIARTNRFGEFAVLIRNRTTIFLPGIRR